MDFITSALSYLMAHGDDIVAIGVTLVAAATAIVKLTPTPKDDEAVGYFAKAVSFVAGLLHPAPTK